MPNSFASAVFFLLSMSATALAAPVECPTAVREDVLGLLDHASTCERSLRVFEACASGAGGDVGLGEVVVKRCERDFLSKLSSVQRLIYQRKLELCARKFQKEPDTMYRSFEAFCSAKVAKMYSLRFALGRKRRHE